MKKLKLNFRFSDIIRFLARVFWWMGENPFLGFLALLMVALLLSSGVFYRYVFMARGADVESGTPRIRFDQQKLQQIIQIWEEREQKFNRTETVRIKNIFERPGEILEESNN